MVTTRLRLKGYKSFNANVRFVPEADIEIC